MKTLRTWAVAVAAVAAAGAAGAALAPAIAMTGGAFSMLTTSFNAGGGANSGGTLLLLYTIGAPSTPMSGGGFTLSPGPLNAVRLARANLDDAHAFPNPFKPALGHAKITFTALMSDVTINVYTVSGRIVRTLQKNDDTDSLVWSPVVNGAGEPLASGVYLYVITQRGFPPKRGKLMVIK